MRDNLFETVDMWMQGIPCEFLWFSVGHLFSRLAKLPISTLLHLSQLKRRKKSKVDQSNFRRLISTVLSFSSLLPTFFPQTKRSEAIWQIFSLQKRHPPNEKSWENSRENAVKASKIETILPVDRKTRKNIENQLCNERGEHLVIALTF